MTDPVVDCRHDGNWDGDYADGCDNVLYYTYDGNFNPARGPKRRDGGGQDRRVAGRGKKNRTQNLTLSV